MRNARTCAKCQSADVLRIPDRMKGLLGNSIDVGWFRIVRVTRYLCASCGHSEDWVDSEQDRAKLKKKFAAR
jgi:hypothetical protein